MALATKATKTIAADRRTLIQNAKQAVRDVFDAIVELVTNADDRYQFLNISGDIQIDLHRKKNQPSILQVRDFADGMTAEIMDQKLSIMGGRVSGMKEGKSVRGTNSRGAKDVSALGTITFESIAEDEKYHKCTIDPYMEFTAFPSKVPPLTLRKKIGIPTGTGTLVTIEVEGVHSIPRHDNLKHQIARLVPFRDILNDPRRRVVLRDLGQNKSAVITVPKYEGNERVKQSFEVPGYPGAKAKLIIKRATKRFEREKDRFRLNGILMKSQHAIHEATLFDPSLENDPHALWFFGKLTCPYIDTLMNAFDDRLELRKEADASNPFPTIDPSRRSGLDRGHPFVKELFSQALQRLRPLVEEERRLEERQRASIESRATRNRLDELEKAAVKFMSKFGDEDEPARDPNSRQVGSKFMEKGYALNPPFVQMIVGHSRDFSLNVRQDIFPEFEVGSTLQIDCLSKEIVTDKRFCGLEKHPTVEGVIRGVWRVQAVASTPKTAIRVRAGSISDECKIEVLNNEADRYRHVTTFCFSKKEYKLSTETRRKKIKLLAPINMVAKPTEFELRSESKDFILTGQRIIRPRPNLGIAIAEITLKSSEKQAVSTLIARLGIQEATARIRNEIPMGAGLQIKLEDIDLVNQRYRWRQNLLEIASRHPSLSRYLGRKEDNFPGQESSHFRILLAEIVADAVCSKIVSRQVHEYPDDYEDADWDQYYAEFSKYMTQFLPTAHQLQYPNV